MRPRGALGWFTREEWQDADGSIVVALAGAQEVARSGYPARTVRVLARALAGIGGEARPADPIEDRFLDMPLLELPEPEAPVRGRRAEEDPDEAGFRRRVEPTWSRKAEKEGGSCTVQVFVTRQGELRELGFEDCPKALQKDVEAAVEAITLRPRTKDGAKAAGRFRAIYRVGG